MILSHLISTHFGGPDEVRRYDDDLQGLHFPNNFLQTTKMLQVEPILSNRL
jgi:hypothetical protein